MSRWGRRYGVLYWPYDGAKHTTEVAILLVSKVLDATKFVSFYGLEDDAVFKLPPRKQHQDNHKRTVWCDQRSILGTNKGGCWNTASRSCTVSSLKINTMMALLFTCYYAPSSDRYMPCSLNIYCSIVHTNSFKSTTPK